MKSKIVKLDRTALRNLIKEAMTHDPTKVDFHVWRDQWVEAMKAKFDSQTQGPTRTKSSRESDFDDEVEAAAGDLYDEIVNVVSRIEDALDNGGYHHRPGSGPGRRGPHR